MATTWKNSNFILSERSDFYMDDNLSIAVHAFLMSMLTLLSVDEILQLNWSNDFRGFNEEMSPYWLKYMLPNLH